MKPRPWEPNFDFYFSSWQSERLVINVDLGAECAAPLPSHPLRLQARIPMRTPREDGLRTKAESEALFALEDLLAQRLGELAPVLQVGRVVGVGEVTLVWYAPKAVLAQRELFATAVREVRGKYDVHLSTDEDPDWTFYFDFLLPDVYNLQVMMNRRRLLTLLDHEDDGSRQRLVDHRACFDSRAEADRAATELEAVGFVVDDPELEGDPELEAGGAPLPASESWVLEFQRTNRLAEGRIDEVCVEILDILLPRNGHYEGWGTGFVPAL